jgi:hypothetical protein
MGLFFFLDPFDPLSLSVKKTLFTLTFQVVILQIHDGKSN